MLRILVNIFIYCNKQSNEREGEKRSEEKKAKAKDIFPKNKQKSSFVCFLIYCVVFTIFPSNWVWKQYIATKSSRCFQFEILKSLIQAIRHLVNLTLGILISSISKLLNHPHTIKHFTAIKKIFFHHFLQKKEKTFSYFVFFFCH